MADTLNDIPAKFHPGEGLGKLELIKNLSLRDLQSIFYICLLGLSASALILIFEIIFSIYVNKFMRILRIIFDYFYWLT